MPGRKSAPTRPLIPQAKVLGCFKTGGVSSRRGIKGAEADIPDSRRKLSSLWPRHRGATRRKGARSRPRANPFNPSKPVLYYKGHLAVL
jgi:hypothetical protein